MRSVFMNSTCPTEDPREMRKAKQSFRRHNNIWKVRDLDFQQKHFKFRIKKKISVFCEKQLSTGKALALYCGWTRLHGLKCRDPLGQPALQQYLKRPSGNSWIKPQGLFHQSPSYLPMSNYIALWSFPYQSIGWKWWCWYLDITWVTGRSG